MKRVLLSCVMLMLILCLFAGCVQPASTEEVTPTAVVSPSPSPTVSQTASPSPSPTVSQTPTTEELMPTQTPTPALFGDLWFAVRTDTPEYGSISSSRKANYGEKEGVVYSYYFSNGNPLPDSITFTALPNEGCRFDGWYNWDKLLSTELIYIYTSGCPFEVVAVFSPIDEP